MDPATRFEARVHPPSVVAAQPQLVGISGTVDIRADPRDRARLLGSRPDSLLWTHKPFGTEPATRGVLKDQRRGKMSEEGRLGGREWPACFR